MQETVEGLQAHVHELDTAVTTQLVEKQKSLDQTLLELRQDVQALDLDKVKEEVHGANEQMHEAMAKIENQLHDLKELEETVEGLQASVHELESKEPESDSLDKVSSVSFAKSAELATLDSRVEQLESAAAELRESTEKNATMCDALEEELHERILEKESPSHASRGSGLDETELSRLKDRISALTDVTDKDRNDFRKQLESTVSELGEKMDSVENKLQNDSLNDAIVELHNIKDKQHELEVRVETCFEELADVGVRAEENSTKLAEANLEHVVKQIESSENSFKAGIDKLEQDIGEIKNKQCDLSEDVGKVKEDMSQFEMIAEKIEAVKAEFEEMQDGMAEMGEELTEPLKAEVEELKVATAPIGSLREQVATLATKVEKVEGTTDALFQEHKDVEEQLESMGETLEEFEGRLDALGSPDSD